MRHRNLVSAAILATLMGFGVLSAQGQQGRPEDGTPDIEGRVTDLAGRSIRNAEVRLISLSSNEVVTVKTNAFGYYRVFGLTEGHTYLLVIEHRRYLFVLPTIELVAGGETLQYDFLGELAP